MSQEPFHCTFCSLALKGDFRYRSISFKKRCTTQLSQLTKGQKFWWISVYNVAAWFQEDFCPMCPRTEKRKVFLQVQFCVSLSPFKRKVLSLFRKLQGPRSLALSELAHENLYFLSHFISGVSKKRGGNSRFSGHFGTSRLPLSAEGDGWNSFLHGFWLINVNSVKKVY